MLAALALSTIGIAPPAKGIEQDAAVGTGSDASAPAGVPGTITTPPALRETDVAFLGGGPATATRPITVTAAGNGVGVRLTSWIAGPDGQAPIRLRDSTDVLDGASVKLHVLAVDETKATPQLLLAATVSDGVLQLSTWRVADDGTFKKLHGEIFGDPAGWTAFTVTAFAVAHRPTATTPTSGTAPTFTDFIVVTPVTGRRPGDPPPDVLRLPSWRVSPAGIITSLNVSIFGASSNEPALDVVYQQAEDRFAIAATQAASWSTTTGAWATAASTPTAAPRSQAGRSTASPTRTR